MREFYLGGEDFLCEEVKYLVVFEITEKTTFFS
jgi:hypothetical protein